MANPEQILETSKPCASRTQRLRLIRATILDNIDTDVTLAEKVMKHSAFSGKGLRALVAHIGCDWCDMSVESCNVIAAAIEMIHFASLLHDDVVDEAQTRRHKSSANAAFGSTAAVLTGDFLYSRASQMLCAKGNLELLSLIADATNQLAEGEVLQLVHKKEVTTEKEYYDVISRKTASLFSASAAAGPVAANNTDFIEPLRAYGYHLGMAFQLVDDYLDYESSSEDTGKPTGNDFKTGMITLPLLRALKKANRKQQKILKEAIADFEKESSWQDVMEIIQQTNVLKTIKREVKKHIDKANENLNQLPACKHQEMLIHLANRTLNRRK